MKSRHVKRKTRYEFAFGEAGKITAHGGQVLVDAMARRLRLWERIAGIPGLDPRFPNQAQSFDLNGRSFQLMNMSLQRTGRFAQHITFQYWIALG